MQHIIKKQIIELSLDGGLDAFDIQQKISDHYFAKIVPLLQEAFDAASNEEDTISIDSLVIDLGVIPEKEIENGTWEEKLFKNITEQLISVKHGISSGITLKKSTSSLGISGQWLFYMQHGYLPWNALQTDKGWYGKVLEAFATDTVAISYLKNLINRDPESGKRIAFQHSPTFLKSLVETLTTESQEVLPHLIHELANITFTFTKNTKSRYPLLQKEIKLWEQVLQLTAKAETKLRSREIIILLLRNLLSFSKLNSKRVKEFLSKNKIADSGKYPDLFSPTKKEKENRETQNILDNNRTVETEKESKTSVTDKDIYVVHAGLVLLHPFLNRFFNLLHLIHEKTFVDTHAQLKALYLLHYIATGNTKSEEYELVMAKVLCAWPLKEPVIKGVELTEKELQEADGLLRATIQQWDILRGTSVHGFRESFLQRKGKISTRNDMLYLQVEQGPVDMLLDHLPWNLSMIKLPWMEDVLKVEWR